MIALDDVVTSAEEKEGASSVGAFRLSLLETLVTNQGALLITHKPTDGDAGQRARSDVAVHLRCRYKFRENR